MAMTRQPGTDRRVTRSRRAILRAALEELAEAGHAGFAMDSVAHRAGVGRSTLYRHWNDRTALLADALEELNVQPAPGPEEADPRRRVELLLAHLCRAVAESQVGRCLPALVHAAERDEDLRRFLDDYTSRRRQALTAAVGAAVASGDAVDVDPELASQALSGAVFYRRLMTSAPMPEREVAALVDTVLGPPPRGRR